jgi:hypothetical protein
MRPLGILLAIGLLASCNRVTTTVHAPPKLPNTMKPGDLITTPGTYHYEDKVATHDLELAMAGTALSWMISRHEPLPHGGSTGGSGGGGMQVPEGSSWFVYLEDPGRYWFSNGKDRLDYNFREDNGTKSGPSIHDGKLIPHSPPVPKEVIQRLPAELQKLLPPVEAPQKQPSI